MNTELLKTKPLSLFFKYLIPALISTAFVNVYVLTDTAMIGQGVGGDGLVALNLILPLYNLFFAIGYLFGNGGSIIYSISKGRRRAASKFNADANDRTQEYEALTTAFIITLALGILFTAILSIFLVPVLRLLGVDEEIMPHAIAYGRPLMLTLLVFMMNPFMQCFVRNDDDPRLPMIGSIIGCLVNIFLDWFTIFYLKAGMGGAIIATIIGYTLNVLITSAHCLKKGNELTLKLGAFNPRLIYPIIRNGIAAFLTEIASAVVILAFNRQLLTLLGNPGVVIFSVISNTIIVAQSVLTGTGNAVQPILSANLGAGRKDRVHSFLKIGYTATLIFSVIIYALIFIFSAELIQLFVKDSASVMSMKYCIQIYFTELFAFGFNQYTANGLQALNHPVGALTISLEKSFALSLLFIFGLPALFGANAIWWATPASETVTVLTSIDFLVRLWRE